MRIVRGYVASALVVAALITVPAAGEEQPGVFTVIRVLVGRPEAVAAPKTQVFDFPGPFVMLGRSAEQEASDVLQLMGKLKEGYRLSSVEIAGTTLLEVKKGQETAIAVPGDDVKMTVTLLASDETLAAYGVTVAKTGEKPSTARVAIARGERGFIGTRDGAQAPYLFLTVEPLPFPKPLPFSKEPGVSPVVYPKLVTRVDPVYPAEASKAKVSGVVILECMIDTDGFVRDLKTVRSEPMGLTDAAVKAVSQWKYEPARDARGKPMATWLTVTITFSLE
jgi:TonB family protein